MRNGKIAALPESVVDELNERLGNGEVGETLLKWLNGLPEVRETLKEIFDGAEINKQNLSAWRMGGFQEWRNRRELREQALELCDTCSEMDEAMDTLLLAGNLATVLAARYAGLLNGWDGRPDAEFEEKLRVLRGLARDVALIEKTMHSANRDKREHYQRLDAEDQQEFKEMKNKTLAPIWAELEKDPLAKILGGGEFGKKVADIITSVRHDLPLPDWAKKSQDSQGQSRPVKADTEV